MCSPDETSSQNHLDAPCNPRSSPRRETGRTEPPRRYTSRQMTLESVAHRHQRPGASPPLTMPYRMCRDMSYSPLSTFQPEVP